MTRPTLQRRLPALALTVALLGSWTLLTATAASADAAADLSPNPVTAGDPVGARVPLPPPVEAPRVLPQAAIGPTCTVSMDDVPLEPQSCVVDEKNHVGITSFVVPSGTTAGSHHVLVAVENATGAGDLTVTSPVVEVPVPDLRPLDIQKAAAVVAADKLALCPPVEPSGYVLGQSPLPPAQVPVGSCVVVRVEKGVDVPDLTGLTPKAAAQQLGPIFLTLGAATGSGTINAQNPQAHAFVPPGTSVDVTLGAVVPPPASPPPTNPTTPTNPTGPTTSTPTTPTPTTSDGPTTSTGPAPSSVLPTTTGGGTQNTTYKVPLATALGGALALVVAFLVGNLVHRRTAGRREAGVPPTHDAPPDAAYPSSPNDASPPRQTHAFGVRVRADRGGGPRIVSSDDVDGARVGLTAIPDPALDPVLVEELS